MRCLLLLLVLNTFGHILTAQSTSLNKGGGNYQGAQSTMCLSVQERINIKNEISQNVDSLTNLGLLQSNSLTPVIVSFDWPLRKTSGLNFNSYYGVSNYVDQDNSSGTLDFNCGNRTYDGHKGFDIFTYPFPWYMYENDYVEVIAAESGVIVHKQDGNADDDCNLSGNWNAVYIEHADGSEAWYGHLKKNSLTNKNIGESINKGEYIGVVASSGYSTGPHLHFEVYDNSNNLIGPFTGNCNNLNNSSWWSNQKPYREPTLNAILTHDAIPQHGCPTVNEEPHFENDFNAGETIYFACYYHDQLTNDITDYKIVMPNGAIWTSWSHTSPSTYNSSWWWWSYSLPFTAPSGTWKFEATYEGNTFTHEFEYVNGCDIMLTMSSVINETCDGDCDGSATVSPSGGTSPYSYLWDDPNSQTTQTATGLCDGNYTVTVTDDNGCTVTASVTINPGNSVTASASVDNHETCAGDCDGQATASGGTNYTWSNGQTTATATGLCAGNHSVTVSDANGCSDVASVTINAGGSVTANASVDNHETCAGDCDGQATASGGTNYLWSNGAATATVNNLCPGNYSVTVSDANGCSDVANVTINAGGSVTASASVDNHETCAGDCDGQATASGGTNYLWSNGAATATISNLCPGNYNVTVSDANGCSDVASVTINAGGSVTASASVDQHETCAGDCDGQATASGGTNYTWSDGQTTATATGLCPGTYDVTVSDANGCSDVASVTINTGNTVNASAVVDNHETCAGDCDGQATASGGTNYTWSDGQTTATATGLCPGTYDVTVSDANGCSDVTSVTINTGTSVTDPTFSFNTTYCEDDSPFSLPTTSDNGITGDWSGPGVSNNTFDPGAAGVGNWDITFTPDPGQCANSATVTMTVQDCGCQNPASADAGPNQAVCATNNVTVQLNGSITNANSATWTTSGTGSFDDPMALDAIYTPSQADKTAGSVTLTLTTEDPDGSGPCSPASDQMDITLNFQPEIGSYSDTSVCDEYELPPYQGEVSNNIGYFDGQGGTGTSYNPGDVITQTKTIFVYDETSDGCIDEVSFEVTINEVTADAGSDVEIPNGTTTTLMGAASDGSGDYAYAWSPANLVVNPNQATTETEALSSNQTFTLEVTDNVTGCVSTDEVVVTVTGGALAVNITASQDTICEGGSTTLTANASGGSGNYSYSWESDPSGFTSTDMEVTVDPSETTVYTVTVDDGFNMTSASVTIVVNEPPTVDVGADRNVCSDVNQFSVTANVTGVSGGSWSSSGSGLFQNPGHLMTFYVPDLADIANGSVTLTFTTDDPAGPCGSVSDQLVVTFVTVSADAGADQDVQYGNAVQLNGSASGGSGNYEYSWTPVGKVVDATDPETMTEDLTQTTDFVLEVTDTVHDCTDRDTVRVTVLGGPLQASIAAPSTDTICLGSSSELEAVVSGGVAPYTYSWSSDPSGFDSDQETVTVSPEVTTTYMVEVADSDGNVVTAEATVVVNSLPLADAGPDHMICYDESSVEVCATNVANAAYGWEHASSGDLMTGQCVDLSPGTWYLGVVDTNTGCTAFDTVTIEQSDELIVELEPDSTVTIMGGTAPYDTTYENTGDTLRVTVVDANGCTATDEVMTTATKYNTLTGVTIYPNPASEYVRIKGLESQQYTVRLYDPLGKTYHLDNSGGRIMLHDLPSGTYYLHVLVNQGEKSGVYQVQIIR